MLRSADTRNGMCGLQGEGSWRCSDCFGQQPHCTGCFRASHCHLPFHRVEHWTGDHYENAWLSQAGIMLHLGHQGLPFPSRITEDLTGNMSDTEPDSDCEEGDGDFRASLEHGLSQ